MTTTNYAQWAVTFNSQAQAVLRSDKQIQQDAARMLFDNIVKRTPIGNPALWKWPAHPDYVPGSLKAAWKIEINGDEVVISNDLPYADRIEHGWSTQVPAGMMKISLLEWNQLLEKATRQHKL